MTPPPPDTSAAPGKRPEPVLGAAAVASALTTVAGLVLLVLVFAHVITPDGQAILGPALASAIPTVVGAVSTLLAAWKARKGTVPLADPRVAQAWAEIVAAERTVAGAVRSARLPSQETPGPDHSA